jgi:hypothetical protein
VLGKRPERKCLPEGLTTPSSMPTPVSRTLHEEGTGRICCHVTASAGSGGEAVLVRQPAETVNSLDSVPTLELLLGQGGNRRLEVDAAVRAGNPGTGRAHHLVEGPDKLRYGHGPETDLSALVLEIGN